MSLLKIPLLVIDGYCMHLCATPPNRPPPPDEHIIPDWREKFLKSLAKPCMFLRAFYYTNLMFELLSIVTPYVHSISTFMISNGKLDGTCPSRLRISPAFILGMLLVISGTTLRLGSFRTLGRFFTFELYLFNDHQLVIDGPYTIIRHPSYTGLILTVLGACCNRTSGSWVWECGLLQTFIGKLLAIIWFAIAMAVIASLVLRIPREDAMLEDQFRGEWIEWAERVPYKLIPWIF